ncbi:MAG TPA: rRNA maturation RNase YbeY [Flavobacteriales bacterium]|nr:rRNA maturation RNase YbeY [Flavobacteriales bacterium]
MGRIHFSARVVPGIYKERERLRGWLELVAKAHGKRIERLSYVLLSDEALLDYNQRYLQHNEYTDIITFDLGNGSGVNGELLLSLDRIRENASCFGVSQQHELRRVMVHGLLHLLGHNDKTPSERRAMSALEDAFLLKF